MPTNQQRRDAAKRKLQRQLERREKQERARRQRLVVVGVVAAVLVVSGAIWLIFANRGSDTATDDEGGATTATAPTETAAPTTPCSYPDAPPAAREVTPPANLSPLNTGTVDVDVTLNGTSVPVTLDRGLAPCGVNAFLSLASQGFYDETTCHRLTVSPALNILQCGDPTGQGNGGPGFSFETEVSPEATYPVGTVALANADGVNGSQFFIVYGETTLSPSYTILGTVTGDGMAVVDEIAAGGTANDAQSGPPATTATIEKVTVPDDTLEGTGTYTSAESSPVIDPNATVLPTDTAPATDTAPVTDTAAPTAASTPASTGGAG